MEVVDARAADTTTSDGLGHVLAAASCNSVKRACDHDTSPSKISHGLGL